MKYKPGDVVTIRSDLRGHQRYKMLGGGEWVATDYMATCAGQDHEIASISCGAYRLVGKACYWTDDMFSGLAEHKYFNDTDVDTGNDPVSFLFGA